jgi:hypothetical protein
MFRASATAAPAVSCSNTPAHSTYTVCCWSICTVKWFKKFDFRRYTRVMRNRMLSLTLLGTLLGAFATPAAAQTGWKKLDGQKAPSIVAKEWLNAGKKAPTAKELRGKVIILEFFATW